MGQVTLIDCNKWAHHDPVQSCNYGEQKVVPSSCVALGFTCCQGYTHTLPPSAELGELDVPKTARLIGQWILQARGLW